MNKLVWVINEEGTEPFDAERKAVCSVGDEKYMEILSLLAEKRDNRGHDYALRWQWDLMKARKNPQEFGIRKIRSLEKLLQISKLTENIDYSDKIKKQLRDMKPNGKGSFKEIEFHYFLFHLHSYFAIKDYLMTADEPTTIVRFDAHSDTQYSDTKIISGNNYVFYLMCDKDVSHKIKEVVTAAPLSPAAELDKFPRDKKREADFPEGRCHAYTINGINKTICFLKDLPEIEGPAILDLDMDGHEKDPPAEPKVYGYYILRQYSKCHAVLDNQQCIVTHPKVAAATLQEKVKDPRLILFATERGFRNGFFTYQIEHDFMEQLMS